VVRGAKSNTRAYFNLFTNKEIVMKISIEKIKQMADLLGQWVTVDESAVPPSKGYPHMVRDPYLTQVVGINKLNASNNGYGANNGYLQVFPDPNGNWHPVDPRMVIVKHGYTKPQQ
jgi:hypothetical protein